MSYFGYQGRILFVNLSSGELRERPLEKRWAEDFVGGRGLGARMLYDLCPRGVDPFGPENPLIFVNGPLEATGIPAASRYGVATKSPLTDVYAYSVAGGFWGPVMKGAGYDALVVTGAAENPVYLLITDKKCEIRDAAPYWGMNTFDTQKGITEALNEPRIKVACIGPAGEHLVRFACVISETRALGRCGVGAVMGSKNLKAVAVGGNSSPRIAQPDRMGGIIREIHRKLKSHPFSGRYLKELGTPGNTTTVQRFTMLPTRNFQESVFDQADLISGEHLNERYVTHRNAKTCDRCPMACARYSEALEEPYRGVVTEGPEYETIWSLGPNCGNANLSSIIAMDRLCDELGLDTMSTGSVIGFAMECAEKGVLSKGDRDGLDLRFGNHEILRDLIRRIAFREGLGDVLAGGTRRAAVTWGAGALDLAMHVKGLELGGYDPRGAKGLGIVYATGNRGGCHHASGYILPDEWGKGEGRFHPEEKAEMVKRNRNLRMVFDSAMLCTHSIAPLGLETLSSALCIVTGMDFTSAELEKCAERINCTERMFNVREGIDRKDDTLPPRILTEPTSTLPPYGRESLDLLLDEYYRISGWDQDGIPQRDYLRDLGIEELGLDPHNP